MLLSFFIAKTFLLNKKLCKCGSKSAKQVIIKVNGKTKDKRECEYYLYSDMYCPTCNEIVGSFDRLGLWYEYCPICGQKIKYVDNFYC